MNTKKNDLYGQIIKYTGIFGSIQGLSILTGVIRNKIMAVMLGTGGMGLMSLLYSVLSFVSQGTNLGLSFSGVRDIATCHEHGDNEGVRHCAAIIRTWSIVAALLGMAVCGSVSPFLDRVTFTWGDHTIHYMMLAPTVAVMAITTGETVILKGIHSLKALAVVQLLTAVGALLTTIPLIFLWGELAIVPMLFFAALCSMVATIWFSFRRVPFEIRRWRLLLREGTPMVKVGLAFVGAALMGTGTEVILRSYLNTAGNLDIVGLYNAGYMLSVTYAGMIFTAMESEYYPRLAAVNDDIDKVNDTVNSQAEVTLLITAPMMCVFIIALPIIVPLLFSSKFVAAVPMAQATALTMMFKSVCLPVSYTMLAKGDSRTYLILEGLSYIFTITGVTVGFSLGGITATGIGLAIAYAIELIVNTTILHLKYGLVLRRNLLTIIGQLFPLVILTYLSIYAPSATARWSVCLVASATCAAISLYHFRVNLRH